MTKPNVVEFTVPTYVIDRYVPHTSKRTTKITIEDRGEKGVLDSEDIIYKNKGRYPKDDLIFQKDGCLNKRDAQALLASLGIKGTSGSLDLGYAQKYFSRVSDIARKVSQGKFVTVESVEDDLFPDPQAHYEAQAMGIDDPLKVQRNVMTAAYDVAEKRHQAEVKLLRSIPSRFAKLKSLYHGNKAEYWKQSAKLRRVLKKFRKTDELAKLNKLDQKAYGKVEIGLRIPKSTELRLTRAGVITMGDEYMADKRERYGREFDEMMKG